SAARAKSLFRRLIWKSSSMSPPQTSVCAASRSMSIRVGCAGWDASFVFTIARPMSDRAANAIRLRDIALAAIAEVCASATDNSSEAAWLQKLPKVHGQLRNALHECLRNPSPEDCRLTNLGGQIRLSSTEILAVALGRAVEEEAIVGRVLAHIQAPVG